MTALLLRGIIKGDDWECNLGDEIPTLNDDSDNVYGVNNLNYLQQQLKGYDAESNHNESSSQEDDSEELSEQSDAVHNDDSGSQSDKSTSSASEDESSGDGAGDETENKTDFIPIPTSSVDTPSTVATQLQRLSQIIKGLSSDGNQSSDLGPADLNEFLINQKIKSEKVSSKESAPINSNARPIPANGRINPVDLDRILDLQKKLNKFGMTRVALSTQATPVGYSVSGSGYYPADATTVHINSATPLQNPTFPEPGYSPSQIVVNRPDGSLLFSLPFGNNQYAQQQQTQLHKNDGISEETLKKLLELSKQMSTTSQPPNIPGFITPTNPTNLYGQTIAPTSPTNLYGQPIIRPVFYNIPVHDLPIPIVSYEKKYPENIDRMQDADSKRPMQKISSVSGHVESDAINLEHKPDDVSLSTVIHNHIPITISNPKPSNSVVNRYHGISSTHRPLDEKQHQTYDSYGHRRPNEHPDFNDYFPYPPYDDTVSISRPLSTPYTHDNTATPYANHRLPPTQETPTHFVKISQSPPDEYPSYNPGIITAHQPIPTFSSDDSSYTTKFYTPSPHLNSNNVNRYVPVEETYPTLQASNFHQNRRPIYAPTSSTYLNRVSSYSTSSLKSGSSERPYDDEDRQEETFGGGGDGDGDGDNNSDQNNLSSIEHSSNGEYGYGNMNSDHSSENEKVMNFLADYKKGLTQTISSTLSTSSDSSSNHENKPLFVYNPSQSEKHKQFVNLAGNFISLEAYQSSIEPYLSSSSKLSSNIEVLTCATGVRQANSTDCTKYFVCNAKTGKVLSYSCPSYTAFNPETKICNAKTYAECFPNSIKTEITIEHNKRLQQQSQLSLVQAQRIKNEALKAQQLAHLIKLETQKILDANKRRVGAGAKATASPTRLKKVPQRGTANQVREGGKRRIPCREEGKLADNLSKYNYFLCFKDKEGRMRARKLLCPAKLIFCASSKVCTSTTRCANGSSKTN